jgi:hypothetical protein
MIEFASEFQLQSNASPISAPTFNLDVRARWRASTDILAGRRAEQPTNHDTTSIRVSGRDCCLGDVSPTSGRIVRIRNICLSQLMGGKRTFNGNTLRPTLTSGRISRNVRSGAERSQSIFGRHRQKADVPFTTSSRSDPRINALTES